MSVTCVQASQPLLHRLLRVACRCLMPAARLPIACRRACYPRPRAHRPGEHQSRVASLRKRVRACGGGRARQSEAVIAKLKQWLRLPVAARPATRSRRSPGAGRSRCSISTPPECLHGALWELNAVICEQLKAANAKTNSGAHREPHCTDGTGSGCRWRRRRVRWWRRARGHGN